MWQSSVCDVRCFVQGFVVFILVELVVLLVHRLFQLRKYSQRDHRNSDDKPTISRSS
jgi:hypothetical protein